MGAMIDAVPIPSGYSATLAEPEAPGAGRTADHATPREHGASASVLGIGASILRRQEEEGCGRNVIGRLATDLRAELPDMKGFSPRNLA